MNQQHATVASHILGIIAIVATCLSAISGVIPAPYGLWAAAGAGALSYIARAVTPYLPATASTQATLKCLAFLLPALLIVFTVSQLSGCAFLTSQAGQTVELAAVDSAIAIAEQKGVSAATINAMAKLALTGDTVASGILAGILSNANPNLTAAEAALTAALNEAVAQTGG